MSSENSIIVILITHTSLVIYALKLIVFLFQIMFYINLIVICYNGSE